MPNKKDIVNLLESRGAPRYWDVVVTGIRRGLPSDGSPDIPTPRRPTETATRPCVCPHGLINVCVHAWASCSRRRRWSYRLTATVSLSRQDVRTLVCYVDEARMAACRKETSSPWSPKVRRWIFDSPEGMHRALYFRRSNSHQQHRAVDHASTALDFSTVDDWSLEGLRVVPMLRFVICCSTREVSNSFAPTYQESGQGQTSF